MTSGPPGTHRTPVAAGVTVLPGAGSAPPDLSVELSIESVPGDVPAEGAAPVLPEPVVPGGVLPGRGAAFEVHLDNFDGPFDLLLGLISKHKLDVTEIALAKVTDDFVGWIRARGTDWDLDETSEFLVVAATLLDLKAARLLPSAEVEDDEDLALLEARDLLFARLLQYRAFKDVAGTLAARIGEEARRVPRAVPVEPQFARLLPELVLGVTPEQLAMIAARAMQPKPPPTVGLEHLHAPAVSVREQAALLVDRLRRTRSASFRVLIADADSTLVIVARFLALLELFREGAVAFDQAAPLADLTIRWTGADDGTVEVDDDFDADDAVPDSAGDPAADPDADGGDRADAGDPADRAGADAAATGQDGDRDRRAPD